MQLIQNNKGVTLVELMIVLVLSLLLMAAVYLTYQLQQASGQSQTQVVATQQDLRAAMDIISVDIMNSGANPDYSVTKQQIQGITNTSGASSLELVMDLNGNGTTNGASDIGEDVIYSLQGTSLTRTCVNPTGNITQYIANNVTQLTFTYFDSTYTPIVPAQSVKFIRVSLIKNSDQVDPQTHQPVTRQLERIICRRNG
ncbi:MAG: prepilin-type N-terminal cleavage/methylation domain-containing protein [Desulfomonilia bacterium]|jgi:type IV pilus assembly protein PilW